MDLNYLNINMSFCGEKFNFAKYLWHSDRMEEGYFTIGVPFAGSSSEILYSAYHLSLLINNSRLIYDSLIAEEVIVSALRNFYELGGKITFVTEGVAFNTKLSLLLDDENIEKILYCIFLIHKFNRPDIFYIKHLGKALEFFPTEEVEIVLAKVIYNTFDKLKVEPYIIKTIPISKAILGDVKNYREVVIWELYQNLRGILVTDKISLSSGKIMFEEEFFDSYTIEADSSFYIKPELREKATGVALVLVLRKMGNSAYIYRPKINTDEKFRTLIFMVASRLMTLNRINFLHGDLHAGNFVIEISRDRWNSDYIQCEDLIIKNNIDLYNSFDLIDFGNSIEFRESDALIEFFKSILPNIYENRKTLIERLARTSPTDFAIAITPLDLYKFVESFFNASKDYEQIRKTKDAVQAYILDQLFAYLDANDTANKFIGGVEGVNIIDELVNVKSIIPDSYDDNFFTVNPITGGAEVNPNYGTETRHHNITHNLLPLYKLLEHFYRQDSDMIDRSRVKNTIQ